MKREHVCECRMCIMARWRAANRHRRKKGMTLIPQPQVPSIRGQREGCPCKVCTANRLWNKLKAGRKPAQADDEMDRIALRWLEKIRA